MSETVGTKEIVTMQYTEIVYRDAKGNEVDRQRMYDDFPYDIKYEPWDGHYDDE